MCAQGRGHPESVRTTSTSVGDGTPAKRCAQRIAASRRPMVDALTPRSASAPMNAATISAGGRQRRRTSSSAPGSEQGEVSRVG